MFLTSIQKERSIWVSYIRTTTVIEERSSWVSYIHQNYCSRREIEMSFYCRSVSIVEERSIWVSYIRTTTVIEERSIWVSDIQLLLSKERDRSEFWYLSRKRDRDVFLLHKYCYKNRSEDLFLLSNCIYTERDTDMSIWYTTVLEERSRCLSTTVLEERLTWVILLDYHYKNRSPDLFLLSTVSVVEEIHTQVPIYYYRRGIYLSFWHTSELLF